MLIGNLAPQVDLPLQKIVTRELDLLGTCASAGEYPECLELVASGHIDLEAFISARAPLEDGAAWFERLARDDGHLLKVILTP